MTPPPASSRITISEISSRLRMGPKEVRNRLLKTGIIPALKIGPRTWLVTRAAYMRWEENCGRGVDKVSS